MADEANKDQISGDEQSELTEEQLDDAAGGIIIVDARTVQDRLSKKTYGGPDARQQFITDEEH